MNKSPNLSLITSVLGRSSRAKLIALSFSVLLASCGGSDDSNAVSGSPAEPDTPGTPTTPVVPDDSASLYLNINNISVAEGDNSTPTLNNTVSLNNVIDAPTADAVEIHAQDTHVWHTGPQLELVFDFKQEYSLRTVHFWNYTSESYDVDSVDLVFSDGTKKPVGEMSFNPALGSSGGIKAEDFFVEPVAGVRYVTATIKGSNTQSDFQNIGFTVKAP